MRNLSANALAQIAEKQGNDPVNIIEVVWTENGGNDAYADRDVVASGIKGRILELSGIDDVVTLNGGSSSQEISVTLDDTDGAIKGILNNNDVHKRPVYVYQWFTQLDLADKFLLFRGEVSSPIVWNEGDRTVSFTVINQLEDKEYGFSPEEGAFNELPEEALGVPWPLCFGTPEEVPAPRISEIVEGTSAESLGIPDPSIDDQIDMLTTNANANIAKANFPKMVTNLRYLNGLATIDDFNAAIAQADLQVAEILDQLAEQVGALEDAQAEQQALAKDSITIINGEKFPQNVPLTLNIGGGLFRGRFSGAQFTNIVATHPSGEGPFFDFELQCTSEIQSADTDDDGDNDLFLLTNTCQGNASQQGFFLAKAGSRVTIEGFEPTDHVVSIVPGDVLVVKAFRQFEGAKRLQIVPESLYEVSTKSFGAIDAVVVTLDQPLSNLEGQAWEDDIYVTFESSVGPNVVESLEYLINTYTDFDIDTASFAAVETIQEPYPADFALLERGNILELLKNIAWQARCALWVNDNTVHLRYLSTEPTTTAATLTLSNVEQQSISLSSTGTEELVTKLVANWKKTYSQTEDNKLILRHNIKKYGTIEQEYDFFIYKFQELVEKSATFWLIRYSNTWKRVSFRAFLDMLNVETLDAVTIDFGNQIVSNSAVKGFVEQAVYESESKRIAFQVWLPVKVGEMDTYLFAWPAQVAQESIFPTIEEEVRGFAGGDGPGQDSFNNSEVAIDQYGELTVMFPDQANDDARAKDLGDRFPSDIGDSAPVRQIKAISVALDPTAGTGIVDPLYFNPDFDAPGGAVTGQINLRETEIYDPLTKQVATLSTFFDRISDQLTLVQRIDAKIAVTDSTDASFDYKYDESFGLYGAGTAFLQD